ncbi:MAG: hypothetical protein QXK94_02625 [Candidatus Jordarchaeales archaeon]
MESEAKNLKSVAEVLLEWVWWGGLVSVALTVLLVVTLKTVSLDNEAASIILMVLFIAITAWGTKKQIEKEATEWKKHFRTWIVLLLLGLVLLVLAILFVPT